MLAGFLSAISLPACGQDIIKEMPEITIHWPAKMFDNVEPKPDHVLAAQMPTGYQDGQPTILLPVPDDVRQGYNGDCWLDATLAALALRMPDAIVSSIADTSEKDCWQVRLFDPTHGHQPVKYLVRKSDFWGNPYASRPNGEVIWPLILEAAFIKLNDQTHYFGPGQGYAGLNGGIPSRAMEAMTGRGYSAAYFPPWVNRDVYAKALSAPLTTVACTRQPEPVDTLVGGHCYSVVSGDSRNKFVIRNPWGISYTSQNGYETYSLDGMIDGFAYVVALNAI